MTKGLGMDVIRFEVTNGKVKIGEWPVDGALSSCPSNWGGLHAVCHVINQGGRAERLSNRVEEIAHEVYRRSPGGATHRLRQALRNANRYLYLRNRAREDRETFLAAMTCVAIRGTDAYASGAGPHEAFLISGGRVHSFLNPVPSSSGVGVGEGWRDDGNPLGRRAVLSEPRFSYRQVSPRDFVLLLAAADLEVFEHIADILPLIALEEETRGAAQHIVRLGRKFSNFSALLVHIGSATMGLQEDAGARDTGAAEKVESPDRVSLLSRLGLESSGAREPRGYVRRDPRTLSKGAPTSHQDELSASPGPPLMSAAGYRREPANIGRSEKTPGRQFLQQCVEMCRVAAALMLSLIYGLWRGGLALCRSVGRLACGIWSWIRQHRVFERAGRGCELALLAFWAGSKGLIIRILPERRSSVTIDGYNASAAPMARAKVVGFNPSRRSRLMIGALLVLGVFLLVTASAVRIRSRLEEADIEAIMTQVEETLLLAEAESDNEARVGLLSQAREIIGGASDLQGNDNAALRELSERVERQWDAASGVVRIPFEADHTLTVGEGSPRRMLIHEGQLYILDGSGQGLYRHTLDQEGRPVTDQDPWTWEWQRDASSMPVGSIIDIEGVDAANGRLTPTLIMLTAEGSLLEVASAGAVRNVSVSDVARWEGALAIRSYNGNLYVLDPGRDNIIKYIPTGDNYEYPPVNYLQESENIRWAKVVDMAIDGSVYLLLSDGSIMKFTGGEPDTFTQEGLYPALVHPTAIFASTDSASVFVAEPEQERIVEFSTVGQFIRQFRAVSSGENPVGDLRSFVVDLQRGRMFIGTAAGLYSAPLPPLQ